MIVWFRKLGRGLKSMLWAIAITLFFLASGLTFPGFFLSLVQNLWIPLAVLLMLICCLQGRKQFFPKQNEEKITFSSMSTVIWVLRIMKTQITFVLIMLCVAVIAIPGYLNLAPQSGISNAAFLSEFITTKQTLWNFYPFTLVAFMAILFGVIGVKYQPKMSSALRVLWGKDKNFSAFIASVFDFCPIVGFFLGLLTITSLMAIFISGLVGHFLGINMAFELTIRTSAVGFILAYLPFSGVWQELITRLSKRPSLSLTGMLLIIGIGAGVLFAVITGIVEIFLVAMQNDPYKTFHINWSFHLDPTMVLPQVIAIVATFAAAVWGIYIAILSTGRSIGAFLLALLPVPTTLFGIIYIVTASENTEMLNAILQPFFLYPWNLLLGTLLCLIILGLWRKESPWLKGLFLIFPNDSGKKTLRFRRIMGYGSSYVPYTMLIWIYVGMYGLQQIYLGFLVAALFVITLAILGMVRYLGLDMLMSLKVKSEAK